MQISRPSRAAARLSPAKYTWGAAISDSWWQGSLKEAATGLAVKISLGIVLGVVAMLIPGLSADDKLRLGGVVWLLTFAASTLTEVVVRKSAGSARAERDELVRALGEVNTALDYGFMVPLHIAVLRETSPSAAFGRLEGLYDELVARAKSGDVHAKAQIPAAVDAWMDVAGRWSVAPGRAHCISKISADMRELGLPWKRPLEPGELTPPQE